MGVMVRWYTPEQRLEGTFIRKYRFNWQEISAYHWENIVKSWFHEVGAKYLKKDKRFMNSEGQGFGNMRKFKEAVQIIPSPSH
ncbi:hypothetical protein Trydic_g2209 [Trypoxylus dichotomus]